MRLVAVFFTLGILLSGCATMDVLTGQPLGEDIKGDVLVQLANNALVAAALEDATATEAWVDSQPNMDPIKQELALACPRAVKFAAKDFHDRVLALKAELDASGIGSLTEVDIKSPRLILHLTQLKYGIGMDPKARLAQMKADIALRLDAIFTGCAHLFPRKQVVQLANLAAKAGLLSSGGGGLALLAP
jgi:hypothetical protein